MSETMTNGGPYSQANAGSALAFAILDWSGPRADQGVGQMALTAAVWGAARRAGLTPRQILEQNLLIAPTDEEWQALHLPSIEGHERNRALSTISDQNKN